MPHVLLAQPYRSDEMSSTGQASNMLVRQYRFPYEYDPRDIHASNDHDRIQQRHWQAFDRLCQEHLKTGIMGLHMWLQQAKDKQVIAFLAALLILDSPQYQNQNWTGYRVTATINRMTGGPVYTLELFHKNRESATKLFTRGDAPNVRR